MCFFLCFLFIAFLDIGESSINIGVVISLLKKKSISKFLKHDEITPFSFFHELKADAQYFQGRERPPVFIVPTNESGSEFEIHNRPLSLEMISQFINEITNNWIRDFRQNVLLDADLNVDVNNLFDDWSDTQAGGSFATNPQNNLGFWGTSLIDQWRNSGKWRQFLKDDGSFNLAAIREWFKKYDEYKVRLGSMFEWTLGMPSRGTEMVTTRFANGRDGQPRHVYLIKGHVCSYMEYNKTNSLTDSHKPILRVMPPKVGQVVALEMLAVHPVRDKFYTILKTAEGTSPNLTTAMTSMIFTRADGSSIDVNTISADLSSLTKAKFNLPFGVSKWRHIMIHLGRYESDLIREQSLESQAGHSEDVAQAVYAVSTRRIGSLDRYVLFQLFEQSKRLHYLLKLDTPPLIL